jgi:predicted nucleic acid-binding protein
MSVIVDSSSIFRALISRKTVKVAGESTLELARYELGNAIFKEHRIFKTLTFDEAERLAGEVSSLLENMSIIHFSNQVEVLKVAAETGTTYYDASYLYASMDTGMILSTEDERLRKAANKLGIRTKKLEE